MILQILDAAGLVHTLHALGLLVPSQKHGVAGISLKLIIIYKKLIFLFKTIY